MRITIEVDDALLASAMKSGRFTSKQEAIAAGLKLLCRQAACPEILKWEGRLRWEGDESIDWTASRPGTGTSPR